MSAILTNKTERKPASNWFSPIYGLIGGVVAGLGFLPLMYVFTDYLLSVFSSSVSLDLEDFMVIWCFWLPAAGFGAVGGMIGAWLARKSFRTVGPWIGAVGGGVAVALIFALLMASFMLSGGKINYQQERELNQKLETEAMRPEQSQEIPSLPGTYQELTTVNGFESLAVSPDSKMLAIATTGQTVLWDIEQNIAIGNPLVAQPCTVYDLDFSPDGRWLVAGCWDRKVIVWSMPDGEEAYRLAGHNAYICSVAVNADGTMAASGDGKGSIILWDLTGGKELTRWDNTKVSNSFLESIQDLEFSPDGKLLAASTVEDAPHVSMTIYDVSQRMALRSLSLPSFTNGSSGDLSFSPDGNLLVDAASGGPVVWDVRTWSVVGATQGIKTDSAISFNRSGNLLTFTNGYDADPSIYIFNAITRNPVGQIEVQDTHLLYAIFLPNGQILDWHWIETSQTGSETVQIGIWTVNLVE